MKLHHLRLRGIGPFRDDVELDLAALGASGMFLLEGPTGSGKSTILDAIVYALYGSVAGSETRLGLDRIRSQFASPSEPSVVDLIFETGSGIYRVRREPEYRRAKLRGTGTTRENAKATLWRLGSPGVIDAVLRDDAAAGAGVTPLATRLDEVGREITRAIGLSREQFTQTVLLPQGEFARFLRADTKDRQAVLTRVFGTEIYEDIEKRLVEMRRDAKAQVAAATATLGGAVARFVEAAGCDQERQASLDAAAESLRLSDLAAAADDVVRDITAQSENAAQAASAAAAAETAGRAAHEDAVARRRLLHRRSELDALAARLEESAAEHDEGARRLARDRAAAPVVSTLARRDRAGTAVEAAAAARAAALDDATRSAPDLAALAEGGAALADLAAAAAERETSRAGELTALVDLEQHLEERERALTAEHAEHETALTRARELREALEARPAERTALVADRDAARRGAAGLADARLAARAAEDALAASRTASLRAAEVDAAAERATAALEAARTAASAEHALRRRRTEGLAAELALSLEPGAACPVCGSAEHPAPAAPDADHVGAEDLAAAEEARAAAETAAAGAGAALEVARARREAALAESGGLAVAEATGALEAARLATAEVEAHAARAARLEAAIEEHDRESAAQRERVQTLAASAGETAATLRAARESLEADVRRVREARGEHPSVAARRDEHRARARAATALREAHLAADQAAARAHELAGEAVEALAGADAALAEAGEEPLGTEAEARAAVLDAQARARLVDAASRRAVDVARLADGLAEPGIAETTADDAARETAEDALTTTAERLAAASDAARAAQSEAGRLGSAAQRTAAARTALAGAITSVTAVRETAGTVLRVADLAAGASADGERIRLSTFVLMRRFEDVVAAANARLALLSGADLELVRDTAARGAQRTGLDLRVIDRRTDQSRVPETLSGGETFFVSLALALGLADIVAAEAGGVQMQTLFIDEGFGSLDPERLDAVIEEIGHLADTGRTVGIVSHVTELKARIPEQIHVRRRADRTSAVTVTA